MKPIEIAQRLAQLNEPESAVQAYKMALEESVGADPTTEMEAAAYILQFGKGEDYKLSYTIFRDLYNRGIFRDNILEIMDEAFYTPNLRVMKSRYDRNCKYLAKYPYIFRSDFPKFEDLPLRFYPYDDTSYTPYDVEEQHFGDYRNFRDTVIAHNFFHDLENPIFAEDVFSQYELEYLRDNVRKSEDVARENHVYLYYASWPVFCSYLACLNLKPLLDSRKFVFLFEGEKGKYPIDFKEEFGVDYSQMTLQPVRIREVTRLIWHTQLSTHNGGDFFNEIFDAHPNLLCLPSMMMYNVEENIKNIKEALDSAASLRDALQILESWPPQVAEELYRLRDRTDKDVLVAMFLDSDMATAGLDRASRIAPAVFFQPHFHNIVYSLSVDKKDRAVLHAENYEQIRKSPLFLNFKYKTYSVAATCIAPGYTVRECTVCGDRQITDVTSALPHDYKAAVTPASCETGGSTLHLCAGCGSSFVTDYTDALGHSWDKGTTVTDATCGGEGVTEYHCTRCGYHRLEGDAAKGHIPGDPATCTAPQSCTKCGAVLKNALGHDYKGEVTAPACEKIGYTAFTCSRCGDSYKGEYADATGHKPGGWIIDKEPTTDSEGSRHKECESCGKTLETEATPKLYLTATTDTHGEAVVGGYFVIVTDTDTKNPVSGAGVALNKAGGISIRLPNSRLLDYADQTTVTVLLVKDKAPVPDIQLAVTDKNENYSADKTDKAGQITVPGASGSTNGDGKTTGGYEDADGERFTLTVKVEHTETGRPIEGAGVSIGKTGKIILNAPYLLFVYLFDKLGEVVRLAPGADASQKLLHMGEGFTAAFASYAPSFHPIDLLIGIAGALLIRLAVYVKGKNAKKYRKGMEYGSARWGTAEDIKPYTDPVFENNIPLTQTERLTMNSRPKQPKYARNKNILVIGGSGSGKTRFFVKPSLMQMHSSYVVTDPKGSL